MTTAPKTKKHRHSQSKPSLYTLHVELIGIRPSIWRRIQIDGRVRLHVLHEVLQAAMGWNGSHLHKFLIRNLHYGIPDPELDEIGWVMHDEKKYRLNQLLDVNDTCDYLYDFGDSWFHRITVESIEDIDADSAGANYALITDGQRACPPENCGSLGNYLQMLEVLEDAPYSDESKALREWAGFDFDPERYDRQAANAAISRMIWNGWIRIDR